MQKISHTKYAKFVPQNKEQASSAFGSNSLIGDNFSYEIDKEDKFAYIDNKFSEKIGRVDKETTHDLMLYSNKDYVINIFYTRLIYDNTTSSHWGEVLIIAYDKKYEKSFSQFCDNLSHQISHGNRYKIDLTEREEAKIIDADGDWMPKFEISSPKLPPENIVVKKRQSIIERLIEAARNRNPGCFIGSVLLLLAVLGGVAYLILGPILHII